MVSNIDYDDGLIVFITLGFLWTIDFKLAVIVGLSWAIAGISKSNAIKEKQYSENSK